ncbi:PREDICTED: 4-hydroxybenzoate polyprenyltransferase, mitochondrial [Papilio xuthus]|uniref:4-hydroxybenzoate polyprenyltransferase, mitochondrial n=1 Tax=Papilio xuthus TaxID=66420 RepID=A0AAJ7E5B9_PAPXU|nr:PREDICTED: 4-hydroxybenzoate polyprenyltransferase, mitochondrial [Papilio xuthus]
MINTNLKHFNITNLKTLLRVTKVSNIKRTIYQTKKQNPCLCGHVYRQIDRKGIIRLYSAQTDHHRQKVVIETSTPKIVIDKTRNEVLPDEKSIDIRLSTLWKKVDPYIRLARWDRPIGVYLLYWPCSWSIALASIPGTVPLHTTLQTAALFLLGAGLMRGAGCTINDMWDKDVDSQVERTKDRPLVSGVISDKQAVGFLAAQLSLALIVLLQLNCYSIVLGASSMLLVVTYPLMKRITNYPQIFLGATFNWGALLGYSAIQGGLEPLICLPLYTGALAWTVVYDTIYAHQDKEDDARIGMKSTALTFGEHTKPALSGALGLSVTSLAVAGGAAGLDMPYYIALAMYTLHAGRQIYTLNPDNPSDCADKFKSNSMVGLIILLGIIGGGYKQYLENRRKNKGKENIEITKSCIFS